MNFITCFIHYPSAVILFYLHHHHTTAIILPSPHPIIHHTSFKHWTHIGELCRYLINTSPTTHPGYDPSYETQHKIRMAFGNGLRSDVWLTFQQRFNIPNIAEFYAATESNIALFCLYNRGMFMFISLSANYLILLKSSLQVKESVSFFAFQTRG